MPFIEQPTQPTGGGGGGGDPTSLGGDAVSRSPSQYDGAGDEAVLTNDEPGANVLALSNDNTGGYSAIAFRDAAGIEFGAVGSSATTAPGDTEPFQMMYVESSILSGAPRPIALVLTSNYVSTIALKATASGVTTTLPFSCGSATISGKSTVTAADAYQVLDIKNELDTGYCGIGFKSYNGGQPMFFGYLNAAAGDALAGKNFLDTGVDFFIQNGGTNLISLTTGGVLRFGGTTTSYPALKRSASTANLQVRLADDSAAGVIEADKFVAASGFQISQGGPTNFLVDGFGGSVFDLDSNSKPRFRTSGGAYLGWSFGDRLTINGTDVVTDGTYTVGIGGTQNGTITVNNGLITAVQEAQP